MSLKITLEEYRENDRIERGLWLGGEMSLRITVPGNPPSKKTSQKIIVNRATGRPMVIPSKQYLDYEKFCVGTTDPAWVS